MSFVLNKSTKKYHIPGCRDVPRIKAENRWDYTGSGADVEGMGYSPCGHCHPDRYW